MNCAEKELLIVLKKRFFGVVQKYYHPATMHSWIPVQGHFKGLCRNRNFWRCIHFCESATFCTIKEVDERSARRERAATKAREILGGDEIQEDIVLVNREHKDEGVVVEGMTKLAVTTILRESGAIELAMDGTMPRTPGESIVGIQTMSEYKGRMEEDTGNVTKVVMGRPNWEDLKNLRSENCFKNIEGRVRKLRVER